MGKIKNKKIFIYMVALCLFGLVMIYSASYYSAGIKYGDSFYFVKKQLGGFVIGLVLFTIACLFDYHKFYKLRFWVLGGSIVLLVLVFVPFIGISANGARRWIGFGGFNLQSSEVAKFGFVIFSSCYLSKNYKSTKKR